MNTSNFGGTGTMYMIDIRNGEFINEYHFNNAAPSSPVADEQKLYVGNGDGYLYSFYLNELIFASDDTTIVIDTAISEYRFPETDKNKLISIVIENKGVVCDDFIISKTIYDNTPEDGIAATLMNTGHLWANSKTSAPLFSVNPQNLTPGNYKLGISVSSKKLPHVKFDKTISVIIEQASETASIDGEDCKVEFYPNPAKDFITIAIKNYPKPVQITIYDLKGSMVFSEELENGESFWNLTDLKGRKCRVGEYIYRVDTGTDEFSGLVSVL
jgi:hypothetical protein